MLATPGVFKRSSIQELIWPNINQLVSLNVTHYIPGPPTNTVFPYLKKYGHSSTSRRPNCSNCKNADFLTITKTSQVYQTSQLDLLVIKMLAKDVYLISILLLNEMISQFFFSWWHLV